MKKVLFAMLLAALTFMSCATQQERAERREQTRKAVTEALSKRQMHIDIRSMNTMRYGMRTVTSDFFLELRGDTLRSYLPYMGQVYQAPMASPSQGLNFETTMRAVRESRPKAHLSRLEIDVRTDEDTYLYVVEVYDSGKANIWVRPQHRDPVSFDGEVATF